MRSLSGKIALVTGAGGGLGRAISVAFAEEGSHVLAVDINGEEAERTADLLLEKNLRCTPFTADMTESDLQDQHRTALAAGFDGVELALHPDYAAAGVSDGPAADELSIRSPQPAGLTVRALASWGRTTEVEAAIREAGAHLEQATSLGAHCLNWRIPPVARNQVGDSGVGFSRYQEALNFAYHLLHGARYEAEATGVALALEAATGGCLLSPVELREIIDAANSWAVGACVDVVRMARIGQPEDWLATLGHRVHSVRVWTDGPAPEKHTGRAPNGPATGELRKVLNQIAYDRIIIAAGDAAPDRQRAYLADLGG